MNTNAAQDVVQQESDRLAHRVSQHGHHVEGTEIRQFSGGLAALVDSSVRLLGLDGTPKGTRFGAYDACPR